jgi:RNA polymerase sigma-B factor
MRDALRHSVARLSERQRLVLRLRYVDELTQGEIGERIGVSQMQVSRILSGIVDRLRCELLEDEVQPAHDSAA